MIYIVSLLQLIKYFSGRVISEEILQKNAVMHIDGTGSLTSWKGGKFGSHFPQISSLVWFTYGFWDKKRKKERKPGEARAALRRSVREMVLRLLSKVAKFHCPYLDQWVAGAHDLFEKEREEGQERLDTDNKQEVLLCGDCIKVMMFIGVCLQVATIQEFKERAQEESSAMRFGW
ncbi:hypothetical protein Tco_0631655 [Tanacetum coccineum]